VRGLGPVHCEELRQAEDTPVVLDLRSTNTGQGGAGTLVRDVGRPSVHREEVEEGGSVAEDMEGAVTRVHAHVHHLQGVLPGDQVREGVRLVIREEDDGERLVARETGEEEGGPTVAQEAGARVPVALVPRCPGVEVGAGAAPGLGLTVAHGQGQELAHTAARGRSHPGRAHFQPAQVAVEDEVLPQNGEVAAKIAKGAAKAEVIFGAASLAAEAGATLLQASKNSLCHMFSCKARYLAHSVLV